MTRPRRGWTLVELCLVLVLLALVGGLVAGVWMRGQRALARTAFDLRAGAALRHAAASLVAELRSASSADPLMVADSAVDFVTPLGAAVVCAVDGRALLLPADRPADEALLAQWASPPQAGDLVHAYRGTGLSPAPAWAGAVVTVASESRGAAACPSAVGGVEPAGLTQLRLELDGLPAGVRPGAWVRIGRRVRYSLYRGGDGAWQLGRRECAAPAGGCAGVQPVAGPLHPYAADAGGTGLHAASYDARLIALPAGEAPGAALVRLALRAAPRAGAPDAPGATGTVAAWLALRNRP